MCWNQRVINVNLKNYEESTKNNTTHRPAFWSPDNLGWSTTTLYETVVKKGGWD